MDLSLVSHGMLLAVLFAISLGGLVKGMTGVGLPIFAVPAVALISSMEEAVVLMVIPVISANLWLVISHRQHRHVLRTHLPFLAMGFGGALIGTSLLVLISDRGLKLLLVIWLGLYLVQYITNHRSLQLLRGTGKMAYVLGLAAGTIQGATGISAQVVAPYYHARGLTPEAYAFAAAFTFLLLSLAQIAAIANLDLFTPARLQLSLLALVPTLVFTQLGISLSRKISAAMFNKILLVTFIVMEINLILDIL